MLFRSRRLEAARAIYPSPHSRKDVEEAGRAPHDDEDAWQARCLPHKTVGQASSLPVGQASCLPGAPAPSPAESLFPAALRPDRWDRATAPAGVAWRFRVPDGRVIEFHDAIHGTVRRTAGVDFGDFVVWRRDDLAAYELAVVADDHAMEIEEVVRGEDLLTSTAQIGRAHV